MDEHVLMVLYLAVFVSVGDSEDPLERMLAVLRFGTSRARHMPVLASELISRCLSVFFQRSRYSSSSFEAKVSSCPFTCELDMSGESGARADQADSDLFMRPSCPMPLSLQAVQFCSRRALPLHVGGPAKHGRPLDPRAGRQRLPTPAQRRRPRDLRLQHPRQQLSYTPRRLSVSTLVSPRHAIGLDLSELNTFVSCSPL
jgi:hypothetical protein